MGWHPAIRSDSIEPAMFSVPGSPREAFPTKSLIARASSAPVSPLAGGSIWIKLVSRRQARISNRTSSPLQCSRTDEAAQNSLR